ncbi:MAG: efflux RND transporter periplasmic adaptor subunit [Firmicutes bacterium]|nr:efflux RND transporter periplasmic adaptor subunit [Bacillota bacterium]
MKKKAPMLAVLVLMVLTLAGVTGYYWHNNTHYVSTEDARVDGEIYRVSPQIAGEIVAMNVREGDIVQAGQVIARIGDAALPRGGRLDRTLVKTPVGGVVINKLARTGEIGAAGQPVAMVVQPDALYITANIEESYMQRVKVGQVVDIALDSHPGQKFTGRVDFIGRASLSTFSLLSQANSGSNFTKVIQRIPVRITFTDVGATRLLYGTNAVVKIHVR